MTVKERRGQRDGSTCKMLGADPQHARKLPGEVTAVLAPGAETGGIHASLREKRAVGKQLLEGNSEAVRKEYSHSRQQQRQRPQRKAGR